MLRLCSGGAQMVLFAPEEQNVYSFLSFTILRSVRSDMFVDKRTWRSYRSALVARAAQL